MILKAIIIRDDNGLEVTHYYDNIEHAMFYYDAEVKATCASISFTGGGENVVIAINKEAHLYDSNGVEIKKYIAEHAKKD